MLRESAPSSREHLHASMALLGDDPSQLDYLTDRLLSASTTELPVLRELLQPHQSTLVPRLWTVLDSAKPGDTALLAGRQHPGPVRSATTPGGRSIAAKIAEVLVRSPLFLGSWLELFRPARAALVPPLAAILRDHDPLERRASASWPRRSSRITSAINPTSWPIS